MRLLVNGQWQDADWASGKTVTQVLNEADVTDANIMTLKADGVVLGRRAHVPKEAECLEVIQATEDDGPEAEVASPVGQEDT
jgi:hypothetical protein